MGLKPFSTTMFPFLVVSTQPSPPSKSKPPPPVSPFRSSSIQRLPIQPLPHFLSLPSRAFILRLFVLSGFLNVYLTFLGSHVNFFQPKLKLILTSMLRHQLPLISLPVITLHPSLESEHKVTQSIPISKDLYQ